VLSEDVMAVQGNREIPQFIIAHSASLLEIAATLKRKDEKMKEMMEELRKLDMIVEVQKELTKLETLWKMKEDMRKMQEGGELKRKRELSKCTENIVMEVVHVEEDQKVEMSQQLGQTGSSETDVCSEVKVNIVSHLDERKKEVVGERKTTIGGKMILCPPDNMREKISDLRRQNVIIEEKEVLLRKIVKRREKIEEKERDCLAEMKDVREKLKILRRGAQKTRKGAKRC